LRENETISGTKRLKDDAERHRAKNNRIKQKTSVLVSLRGRIAAVAIFKPKAWHPVAKHGSAKQKRKPYHKKWICCVVPLPLSLFQGSVSFRSTIVRFGMTNRSVKDCRVGRKKCALLAMTESVGLIENTERKIQSLESVKRFFIC